MSDVANYIAENREMFLKYAKAMTKRLEVAEDVLQSAVVRLMVNGSNLQEVKDKNRFIKSTMRQVYSNYITVNKKYVTALLEQNENGDWVEVEFEDRGLVVFNTDEYSMKVLLKKSKAAGILTKSEISAIDRYLKGESIDSKSGEYTTLKIHRRNATLKIRQEFVK